MTQDKHKPIAAGKSSFALIGTEKLFAALQIEKDAVILDAACGFGAYTMAMAPHCPQGTIFAVDLWQEGINRLSQAVTDTDFTNIKPMTADISDHIPLDNAMADICLLATVLHDLIQDGTDQGALREIKRVLRPDGILAVIEFKKISGPPGPPVNIRISPAELDEMLRLYGFDPLRNREIDLGPYNYLTLYRFTAIPGTE